MRWKNYFLIPVILLSVPGLTSCNLDTSYFADYENLNLISAYDLNLTGTWSLLSNAGPLIFNDNYMQFQQVGVGAGPSGSESFRLEIKNLFPNGDFQAGLGGVWVDNNLIGTPDVNTYSEIEVADAFPGADSFSSTRLISGNTLKIITQDLSMVNSDRVSVNLSTFTLPVTAAAIPTGTYELRVDYRTYGNLIMHYYRENTGIFYDQQTINKGFLSSGGPKNDLTLDDLGSLPGSNLFVQFNLISGSNHFLVWGFNPATSPPSAPPNNNQVTMVDNIRLVRTDDGLGELMLEMTLPDLQSSSLTLLPGIYEFSVWVRDEALADVTPLTPNRFPSSKITLTFTANQGFADYVKTQTFTGPWAGWTQLTLRCENVQFSSEGLTPTQPALRLRISPTDMTTGNGIDAGSLLISRPELFFLER